MTTPRIVAAVGQASASKVPGLAKAITEAMSQAVYDTINRHAAEGLSLPSDDELRDAQLAARAKVVASWHD